MRNTLAAGLATGCFIVGFVIAQKWPRQLYAISTNNPGPTKVHTGSTNSKADTNALLGFTWSSIETTNYFKYIANLRSIGCPEQTIRDIIIADINKLFGKRFAAFRGQVTTSGASFSWSDKRVFDLLQARNALLAERRELIVKLLGPDAIVDLEAITEQPTWVENRLAFLPLKKQQVIRTLEEHYRHLQAVASDSGFPLPEDAAERQRLEDELQSQIAKLLTPRELALYQARVSGLLNLYELKRSFAPNDDEVVALYEYAAARRAAKAPDSGITDEDALRTLRDKIGTARVEEFQRHSNPEFKEVFSFSRRFALPASTADAVWDIKVSAEAERTRLVAEGRQSELRELQQRTEADVKNVLGAELFDTYRKHNRSGWMLRVGHSSP